MTPRFLLVELYERWIILHPTDDRLAWSGSRWVRVTKVGLPLSVQVCNFTTKEEAECYWQTILT